MARTGRPRAGRRAAAAAVVAVGVLLVLFAAWTVARWAGDDEETGVSDPADPGDPADPADPGDPGDPADPTDPEEETTPEPQPAPQPAPDVVTEADDGATLTLVAGEATALRLSSDWLWEEPQVSGGAVALARVDHFADPGYAEWQVEATATGTADVEVDGSPNCDDEAACPPRTVALRFEVQAGPPEE